MAKVIFWGTFALITAIGLMAMAIVEAPAFLAGAVIIVAVVAGLTMALGGSEIDETSEDVGHNPYPDRY